MKTKFIYAAWTAAITLGIGAVTANGALGDLLVSINGDGTIGNGLIYEYTPTGVQSLFASSLDEPRGMAFDALGNLFVANTAFDEPSQTRQASIVKITPGGARSTFATFTGNLKAESVVFDRAGNLFVVVIGQTSPPYPATIYKFTPDGARSTFGSVPGWVVGNLAFDSAGNLFAGDAWFAYIYKFAPNGTRSVFADPSDFGPDQYPGGLAFDRFGNLFASTEAGTPIGNDTILKFTPDGVESTFATNLDWPNSLAFDASGNLFVAEWGAFAPRGDILRFTPNGNRTVFAPNLDTPTFLAFQLPTTNPATNLASFSATLNGSLNPGGSNTTVYFQYGLTNSYGSNTAMQTQTGNTVRAISANISGLSASTRYHFRIVAHNAGGTVYGIDRTFTTLSPTGTPVVITNPASYIASFSARLNGSVDPHGLNTTVYFQYGTTTSYGLTTAIQSKTGNTYQNVVANISGLAASTTYHFRIVATNSSGTRFGTDRTFTTLAATGPPVVITNPATNVATSSATLNGAVDPHGLATSVHFQYGTTTSYGLITPNQSKNGSTYQNVTGNISALRASTTYHFRIVATNSTGTRYGADKTFTTP